MTIHGNRAFTLSEVLITLGIIGVVAAMTLPNLIMKYEKQKTVEQLKVAYSLLSQAVSNSVAENGDIDNWDYSLLYKDFCKKYIIPYMKVVKECDGAVCENTKMEDGRYFNGYYEITGDKFFNIEYSFVLSNGMIVMCDSTSINLVVFTVDIDGQKGKNTLGKDIFAFYLLNHSHPLALPYTSEFSSGLYIGGVGGSGIPHSSIDRNILLSPSQHRGCNKEAETGGHGGIGTACAALIAQDGWKISDDYPW